MQKVINLMNETDPRLFNRTAKFIYSPSKDERLTSANIDFDVYVHIITV